MDFFSVLTTLGGLALFLYGMNSMGDGLEKISGGKLKILLQKLTSKPVKAVLLGAAVTAVIQSSSATTVMVVGLVNSGIMKLSQAAGVIMGANIGTTITSWILSLTGIESSSFFVRLFKPSSFSPILATVGVIFLLFIKNEKKKDIGNIMLGFAVLMFGMETMSASVKPLANIPEFSNILVMFSNPILGVIAGMLLTAVIQSSSASVGILQALCSTGSLSYGTALPIIMGQNIGTCITALLSAIGASKNAKRASLVHLYFNIIGTTLFLIGFYSLNFFIKFEFLEDMANPFGIAVIHSIFNIVATVVLLPFAKVLVKLTYMVLREDKGEVVDTNENEFKLLDIRFLEQPSFATQQCKNVTLNMVELVKSSLFKAIGLLKNYDKRRAEEIREIENKVDRYEDELGTYLVKLSSKSLTEKDSRIVSILLHSIGDFERISDHAINIMEAAQEMHNKKLAFSEDAVHELDIFTQALKEIIISSIQAFETEDCVLANTVEPLEEVIDDLNEEIKKRHIKRLRAGKCTIELGFVLSDITNNYERIADHCSNIAVCLIQLQEGSFDTHEYLGNIKKSNEEFNNQYIKFKDKYFNSLINKKNNLKVSD